MDTREHRIRERAHQLWEREGRPEDQEKRHWEAAERAIDEEDRGVGAEDEDRTTAITNGGRSASTEAPDGRVPVVGESTSDTGEKSPAAAKAPPKRASRRRAAPMTPVDPASGNSGAPSSRH